MTLLVGQDRFSAVFGAVRGGGARSDAGDEKLGQFASDIASVLQRMPCAADRLSLRGDARYVIVAHNRLRGECTLPGGAADSHEAHEQMRSDYPAFRARYVVDLHSADLARCAIPVSHGQDAAPTFDPAAPTSQRATLAAAFERVGG